MCSVKHSRSRSKLDTFEYRVYEKPDLCVVTCLKKYLREKNNCADHKQLITSYGNPYKSALPDFIRRWIKELFTDAKIGKFIHNCCHAGSNSAAMTMNIHCVKSIRIRSYSGPHFSVGGLKTERYFVSLRIQSEYEKMRTRITPNMDTFYAEISIEDILRKDCWKYTSNFYKFYNKDIWYYADDMILDM